MAGGPKDRPSVINLRSGGAGLGGFAPARSTPRCGVIALVGLSHGVEWKMKVVYICLEKSLIYNLVLLYDTNSLNFQIVSF